MDDVRKHLDDHLQLIKRGFDSVSDATIQKVISVFLAAFDSGATIFTCGNGASAAISSHMACDYTKGTQTRRYYPRVISLSADVPIITAIGNDISYDEIYSFQLDALAKNNDLLVVFSSSGNSPNIVKALEKAKYRGLKSIAFTGFDGGKAKELADVSVHVDIPEYEATEDVHQALMQIIAKIIRKI